MQDTIPSSATVLTPDQLAAAMVSSIEDSPELIWLDPCIGSGAFVRQISAAGVPRRRILACDIRADIEPADELAIVERGTDFVTWGRSHQSIANVVVMNPPYVAISKLRGNPLSAVLSCTLPDGSAVPKGANYWVAFVTVAMGCLRPGGALVMVLPAAWEYADYAHPIRDWILGAFGEVVELRSLVPLFPDVREGSVVVVAKGLGAAQRAAVRLEVDHLEMMIQMLEHLSESSRSSTEKLDSHQKVSRTLENRLGDILTVSIGCVTGDSKFFLMTEQQRIDNHLPESCLRPVLSRSRHLLSGKIDLQTWKDLRFGGERVWLFCPPDEQLDDHFVAEYIRFGLTGGCRLESRHIKCRSRWYRPEVSAVADGYISGMSRHLPFIAFCASPELSATNTLYTVRFKEAQELDFKAEVGLALLSSSTRHWMLERARRYPDGLLKFEPSDLSSIPMPKIGPRKNSMEAYVVATRLLLDGDDLMARNLADQWLRQK